LSNVAVVRKTYHLGYRWFQRYVVFAD
jgi:hypothetical protein